MENHPFKLLEKITHKPQTSVGNNPYSFGIQFVDKSLLSSEIDKKFNRNDLQLLIQNPNIDILNAVIAIISWGGIKATKYQKNLFKRTEWFDVCNKIRNGEIKTREDAYQSFQLLRTSKKLPGLGPAFFTKLICFLNPSLNGYIMDQWTAKSVNLIFTPSIKLSKYGQVMDSNSSAVYEDFCIKIEELAVLLKTTPINAEEIIFSHGGKLKGEWREYIIKNTK